MEKRNKELNYNISITPNRKANEYNEFDTMVTITELNYSKDHIKVCDIIFNKDGEFKEINSEIEKEKVKEILNKLVDDNFIRY